MTADEGTAYACHACPDKFKSLKDLTGHYEKEHPDLIEELIMPI